MIFSKWFETILKFRQGIVKRTFGQESIHLLLPLISGCLFYYYGIAVGAFVYTASLLLMVGSTKKFWSLTAIFGMWVLILNVIWPKNPLLLTCNSLNPTITGVVKSYSFGNKMIIHVNGQKVVVALKKNSRLFIPSEKVKLWGRFTVPIIATNHGQFDYPRYLKSCGIFSRFKSDSVAVLSEASLFQTAIFKLRMLMENSIKRNIRSDVYPIVRSALLGSRDLLTEEDKESFSNSGMYHLLAISGLHVGAISFVFIQLLSFFRIAKKPRYLITGLILILYMLLCGSPISVVRTTLMYWGFLPAILWERPVYSLNNLALSCLLCLLWMPYQILSLGFQLSFLATFFLLYYSPLLSAFGRLKLPTLIQSVCCTLGASGLLFLVTYPILGYSLHQVSPLAIVGNVATIFLTTIMVFTAVGTLLFSLFSFYLASWMGEVSSLAAGGLKYSVTLLSEIKGGKWFVETPSYWVCFVLFSLLLLFPLMRKRKRVTLVLWGLLLFSGMYAVENVYRLLLTPAKITFMDVGQGDSILLELPGDVNVLIDGGPGGRYSNTGKNILLPFLKQTGKKKIDYVMITHPDLDHYGGLAYLLDRVEVGAIFYSGQEAETLAWKALRRKMKILKVPMRKVVCGESIYQYSKLSLKVLSPCELQFKGRNNNSVVTLLTLHHQNMLFTGDMEREAERWFVDYYDFKVDILKIAHHGSKTSSSQVFIDELKPKIGVLSAGRKNRYSLPHPEVMARYSQRGIKVFNTQTQGAVHFSSSKWSDQWRTMLNFE